MVFIKLSMLPFISIFSEVLSGKDITRKKKRFCQMHFVHHLIWSCDFYYLPTNMVHYIRWFWILNQFCFPRVNPTGYGIQLFSYIAEFCLLILNFLNYFWAANVILISLLMTCFLHLWNFTVFSLNLCLVFWSQWSAQKWGLLSLHLFC